MFDVVWTEVAADDIQRHFDFLNVINSDAASRAVRAILNGGASLSRNPYRGMLVDAETDSRRLLVPFGKYGFILYYRVLEAEQRVVVNRVHHGREDRA
jgi:plasmid stabilization system protein ParE